MTSAAAPLVTLRRHAAEAPWSLGELAALIDTLLASAGAAPERPTSERTVRYYVAQQVVQPPFGRGPASTWGYVHLVELLAARLAQQDGDPLQAIAARREAMPLAALEVRVADRLGAPLPPPPEPPAAVEHHGTAWRRVVVSDAVELHLRADHPLLADSRRLGAVLDGLRQATAPSPEAS